MKPKQSNEVTGVFLSFAALDVEKIYTRLESLGYSPDNAGLKKFIFDELVNDEEPETVAPGGTVEKIQDFIDEHPEIVGMGIGYANSVIKKIAASIKKAGN